MGCSLSSSVVGPLTLDCKVWACKDGLDYPEVRSGSSILPVLSEKCNIGFAFSGGGMRAAVNALGWLLALKQLDLIHKFKYFACVSGSSWAICPYAYLEESQVEDFLGPYVPPGECSPEMLSTFPKSSLSRCLASYGFSGEALEELFLRLGKSMMAPGDRRDYWSRAVSECYFDAFGLGKCNCIPSLREIVTEHSDLPWRPQFSLPLRYSAFPIVVASMYLNERGDAVPVEFTPMYYGIPFKCTSDVNASQDIGATFVEPVGFLSVANQSIVDDMKVKLKNSDEGAATISLPLPDRVVSISEQAGISSQYLAQLHAYKMSLAKNAVCGNPVLEYWSQFNPSHKFKFCDGGVVDVCAIFALLRRGVDKVVLGLSNNAPIYVEQPEMNVYHEKSFIAWIAGLFGCAKSEKTKELDKEFNEKNQVFETEDFDRLLSTLIECSSRGDPVVCLAETKTVECPRNGIRGGRRIQLLIVVNSDCRKWRDALPSDTKKLFEADEMNNAWEQFTIENLGWDQNLQNFPVSPVGRTNYSPVLVGATVQMSCWSLVQSQSLLETLMS